MRKGEQTVLCVLTREALAEAFGSDDQCQWEDLFKANRTIVEAIASEIYDGGEHRALIQIRSGGIRVTASRVIDETGT